MIRWAQLIGPQTLAQLNERAIELARGLKITRGRKLRVDSTVVETTIHHPTDSRILGEGVRVLSRVLRRAQAVVGQAPEVGQTVLRSRTRSVRRLAQHLHRCARRKGEAAAEQIQAASRKLVTIAEQRADLSPGRAGAGGSAGPTWGRRPAPEGATRALPAARPASDRPSGPAGSAR